MTPKTPAEIDMLIIENVTLVNMIEKLKQQLSNKEKEELNFLKKNIDCVYCGRMIKERIKQIEGKGK